MADTDAPTDQVDDTTDQTTTDTQPDPKDEHAAMAAALKKANGEAAKFRRELEKLRTDALSDNERAVALARAEGLAEGVKTGATRLVDAEVRAAVAGRNVDVKALLEGLDRTRFLTDDGEPDTDRIAKWVDRIAPPQEEQKPGVPRVPTGPRGPATPQATPEQVFADFLNAQRQR